MWALGAGLLLGLLVWGIRRVFAGYPRPPHDPALLSDGEYATIEAAALASFPPGGTIAPSGVDAGIPSYVDRYLGVVAPRTRLLIRLLLFLVEHATLILPAPGRGGMRRFSALTRDQQTAYLGSWRRSRLLPRRLVFTSLRAVLTMGYFADPAVMRALGLAPRAIETPICDADLLWPPVGRSRDGLRLMRSDLTAPSDGTPLGPEGPLHPDFEAPG